MADECGAALLWKVYGIVLPWHKLYRSLGQETHSLTLNQVVIKEDVISAITSRGMVKREGDQSRCRPVRFRNRQVDSTLTRGKDGFFTIFPDLRVCKL